jgi:hypothetical protein
VRVIRPSSEAEVVATFLDDVRWERAALTPNEVLALRYIDYSFWNELADKLVVLEGHVRLTALALRPDLLPPELEVLLGRSLRIAEWACW